MLNEVEFGVPVGWEPIPDSVLAELPPPPDDEATSAEEFAAALGPAMCVVGEVDQWAGVPLRELSDAGQEHALGDVRRLEAQLAAHKLMLVAAIAERADSRRHDADNPCRFDWGPEAVAVALRVSVQTADRWISLARNLTQRLTATLR